MKKLLCFLLLLSISFVCMAQEVEIRVHEVQRGESLEHVASMYGVTVGELNSYNLFLDKYFYVGQKLNVPIKIVPKVEPAYSTHSSYSEPVKKERKGNGLRRFLGNVFSAAFGHHPYAQPQMYSPVPSYGGGFGGGSGNMDYLLNPNIALMQAQQQMGLAQQHLQEQWKISQQSQEFFEQQNNAWQTTPQMGAWNTMPILPETSGFVPSANFENNTSTIHSGNGSSVGHSFCSHCANTRRCPQCSGDGRRTDNLFGTGKSATANCGVCGGSGKCPYCK